MCDLKSTKQLQIETPACGYEYISWLCFCLDINMDIWFVFF